MSSLKFQLMRQCKGSCTLTPRFSVLAVAFAGLLTSSTVSQSNCGTIPFKVSQPMVERVVFNREVLMQMFPQGGEGLTYWAAIIGSSSRAAMPSLAWILKVGNNDQKTSTIAGLARAARQCESGGRLTSRLIEQTVRSIGSPFIYNQFARLYRGQESAPSAGLSPSSEPVQPSSALNGVQSALLPERKLHNGLSLYLSQEQMMLPSSRQIEPYNPIR